MARNVIFTARSSSSPTHCGLKGKRIALNVPGILILHASFPAPTNTSVDEILPLEFAAPRPMKRRRKRRTCRRWVEGRNGTVCLVFMCCKSEARLSWRISCSAEMKKSSAAVLYFTLLSFLRRTPTPHYYPFPPTRRTLAGLSWPQWIRTEGR